MRLPLGPEVHVQHLLGCPGTRQRHHRLFHVEGGCRLIPGDGVGVDHFLGDRGAQAFVQETTLGPARGPPATAGTRQVPRALPRRERWGTRAGVLGRSPSMRRGVVGYGSAVRAEVVHVGEALA